MAADLPGLGTKLQCKPVSSGSYVDIPQIISIEASGIDNGQRNPTTLDSAFVEKKPTILDCGELAVNIAFDPNDSVHIHLRSACSAKSTGLDYKLVFADGNTTPAMMEVKGYNQSFEIAGMETDGTLEATITIPLTSFVAMSSGSSA